MYAQGKLERRDRQHGRIYLDDADRRSKSRRAIGSRSVPSLPALIDFRFLFAYNPGMFRDLFETLALLPHETVLIEGRQVHKRGCVRCKLQAQIADLHSKVRLFTKEVDDSVGEYPSSARIDKG